MLGAGIMAAASLPVCVERRAGCHEDINDKSLTLGMTEAAKLLNKAA